MIDYIKETLISYKPFLVITAVAFVLDFITGIVKAILNRAIQSEKLKRLYRRPSDTLLSL